MKHVLFAVLCATAACGKGGGGVDLAAFKTAQEQVKTGDAWGEATAKLEKALGPAKKKTDSEWSWAAVDGDTCADLTLMKGDGDKVNGVSGSKANKMIEGPFKQCEAIANGK